MEHLIASALGGRRKVANVLCTECNNRCGQTIDAGLADAYAEIRMALAVEGDRGQTASVAATDATGRRVYVDPGLAPRAARGKPDVIHQPDGKTFTARFSSEREAVQYVEALKRQNPGKTITINDAVVERIFPEQVKLELQVAGHDVIRSCVKSALTLVAYRQKSEDGLEKAWAYVARGPTTTKLDAFLTIAPAPWSLDGRLGPVPHLIAVASSKVERAIRFQVRLFGDIAFCGTLAANIDVANWMVGYAVDPLGSLEEPCDEFSSDLGTPSEYDDALFQRVGTAVESIIGPAYDRSKRMAIDSIVRKAVADHLGSLPEGSPVPEEATLALSKQIAEEATALRFRLDRRVPDLALLQRMQERTKKREPPET
jgi:HNH endonuclease